jgi:heme-degrading monooxygenase HmoA
MASMEANRLALNIEGLAGMDSFKPKQPPRETDVMVCFSVWVQPVDATDWANRSAGVS